MRGHTGTSPARRALLLSYLARRAAAHGYDAGTLQIPDQMVKGRCRAKAEFGAPTWKRWGVWSGGIRLTISRCSPR
ncbi:hypothetical protein SSPO_018110 [Streptomyces antimycoticus]|uniref:Uncharacterized protein n=1 Tax=Streptomyces antimycoticus TaxID=68175 RepID=A0A499UDB5_9ACTN|nr:hypothetical protein SSPO_018110 [Streptomyces antimycoticus]